ncbi:MAG: putative zinc-binding metallopeptidase [Planctomycetales bacterium]|nr:putative zinc-binding metallopeptidase [Planctomycetales bacterium]
MNSKTQSRMARRKLRQHIATWSELPDSELLDWRLCDLGVQIDGTVLELRIERLLCELEARGLRHRPHFWLSDEWFSPDGIPGIAIPFYLAHPRLARLERSQMLEIEGGDEEWCLRILRHEAGHTIDTAYRLYRRKKYQQIFGKASEPYPEHYQPRPYSRRYVQHLDMWYAQSHPAEDFAETFAVWLKPRSRWRTQYAGWPAMKKLEYVDELMQEIAEEPPQVTSRRHIEPLKGIRRTLREHYDRRREHYGVGGSNVLDDELRRLFSEDAGPRRPSAATFLRRNRRELRRVVATWTGQYQYTIDEVLGEIINRCRELDLRLDRPATKVKQDAIVMLTVQIMNHLHSGNHKVAL